MIFRFFSGVLIICLACSSCNLQDKHSVDENQKSEDTTQTDKYLEDLNAKISSSPGSAELLHIRAKYYINKKDFGSAFTDLQDALKIDSTKAGVYLTLADLTFLTGKTSMTKDALEKCLLYDNKNIDALLKLAELFLYVQEHRKSIEYLDDVLKIDVHNAKAYFIKGMNFKETGDTAKALSSFQTAIEQNPEFYSAYMQLGVLNSSRKNKIALQYFNSALALRPASIEALYGRAMVYQETNDIEKALEDYNLILHIKPDSEKAHFNLGFIQQTLLNDYKEAIKHYTNSINAKPDYADAYYNRGLCYELLNDKTSALKDYEKALEIKPAFDFAVSGLKRVK